jgi:hypothetical protein
MNPEFVAFVEDARRKGLDHATIRSLLLSSGWKEKDVAQAFTENVLEVPVPPPPDAGSAREAYLHLLTFAAFYTAVVSVTMLFFAFINHHLPDPSTGDISNAQWEIPRIRWQLAVTIVSFPLFLWFSHVVAREMRAHPERAWSGVRRWLTYLTLFAASIALACDGVTLLYNLLAGEISTRFLAKVGVVFVIAGVALLYYLVALRTPANAPAAARRNRAFATTATALTATAVIWGFVLAGSPGTARVQRFDDRRVRDLQGIDFAIRNLCLGESRLRPIAERTMAEPLPSSLADLASRARERRPTIVDPLSGAPYSYEVLDESRYRLCAEFEVSRDEDYQPEWNHPAGRACFDRDVLRQ